MTDPNTPAVVAPESEISLQNGSKEIGEIFVAIAGIVEGFRAKKSIIDIGKDNFAAIETAVKGFEEVAAELKDKKVLIPTVMFHIGKILASF
jgi:hypothetical protein